MKREQEKNSGLTETSRDNQDIDLFLDLLEKDIDHSGKWITPSQ
ncbi:MULTISPECIES: hypothetical protein [Vibrio]|nr:MULTISPECIES: hypothetical protein [Vibrio]MDG2626112.1 hypothetical protein [Vibrio parahaemolyticus]MDW1778699.1 hypothetical protein [Vibrio sp. Vb2175]